MSIQFEPFRVKHLEYIRPCAVQTDELQWLLEPANAEVLQSGVALSVWESGVCLGAAGVIPVWATRAEAWAMFTDKVGFKVMRACVKTMKNVLDGLSYKRVDMSVRAGNLHGHVLAKATGFVYECRLEAYHVSGDDMFMYKRIKR